MVVLGAKNMLTACRHSLEGLSRLDRYHGPSSLLTIALKSIEQSRDMNVFCPMLLAAAGRMGWRRRHMRQSHALSPLTGTRSAPTCSGIVLCTCQPWVPLWIPLSRGAWVGVKRVVGSCPMNR